MREKESLSLRLIYLNPLEVDADTFGLQDKEGYLLAGEAGQNGTRVYTFSIDMQRTASGVNLLGAYVYGTPAQRFLYISFRRPGGQGWARRVKVPLGIITPALADEALALGRLLVAAFDGQRSGTVPLAAPWAVEA
jgi:hypothetical protein